MSAKDIFELPTTVSFDVGGKVYKVSRSLLEQYPDTMLARIASDTWQSDPNKTIFIDRDGERFCYCLDYLRDRRIDLPMTVSKAAVVRDLEYFGIDFDAIAIRGPESLASIVAGEHRQIEEHQYHILAIQCFLHYSENNELRLGASKLNRASNAPSWAELDSNLFNKYLFMYGLKFESCRFKPGEFRMLLKLI